MPTIEMSQAALRGYLHGEPSDQELQEAITMIGTDLDGYGETIRTEVPPNRPDLLSAPGLARALNTFLGYDDQVPEYNAKKGVGVVKILPSAAEVRPHTRCAIVRGLTLDDERIKQIIDLQEKLHITFGRRRKKVAIGVYPLERIELPITFGAEKPEDIHLRPLEWPEELDARRMLTEHPTGQKYAHLLEGAKRFPVFRDADAKVLSVPPVINSHDVGKVNVDTEDVFIECSGHDPKPLSEALNMIVCALADMGGTIESMTLEYDDWHITSPDLSPHRMMINWDYLTSRAGISEDDVRSGLAKMGVSVDGDEAVIPPYRTDFLHQVDLVEDACIGYGYNDIMQVVPEVYAAGALDSRTLRDQAIRQALVGLGMHEAMTYYLTSDGVALANPLTEDYSHLRSSILRQLLDVLRRNINNSYPQRFFEVGPVFVDDDAQETRVREDEHVACILCEDKADYTVARQTLEALARAMGWTLAFTPAEDERFIPGRCARVSGDVEGIVGEVHPQELASRDVQMPASGWEVTLK